MEKKPLEIRRELILEMRDKGKTYQDISEMFNITRACAWQVVTGYKHKPVYKKEGETRKKLGACYFCNRLDKIDVHHIDKDRSNNNKVNLIALCKSCHVKLHNRIYRIIFNKND